MDSLLLSLLTWLVANKIYLALGLGFLLIFIVGSFASDGFDFGTVVLLVVLGLLVIIYFFGADFSSIISRISLSSFPRQTDELTFDPGTDEDELTFSFSETVTVPVSGDCSLSTKVPDNIRQYCLWIDKYGAQYNVEPTLIAAIIRQECPSGNPKCMSNEGAVGLMQVMPSDGLACQLYCKFHYFDDRPTVAQLQNPEFNIKTGAKILADYISQYGTVRGGVIHYGPTQDSMRKQFGDPDYYVNLVMSHYNSFK